MKRIKVLLFGLFVALCLTSCKKDEDFFVGYWTYSEVLNNGSEYSLYLNIRDNGQFDLDEVFSRGAVTLEKYYYFGSWSLVNEEQISCFANDEDGETASWTFRKRDNALYWVDERLEFSK